MTLSTNCDHSFIHSSIWAALGWKSSFYSNKLSFLFYLDGFSFAGSLKTGFSYALFSSLSPILSFVVLFLSQVVWVNHAAPMFKNFYMTLCDLHIEIQIIYHEIQGLSRPSGWDFPPFQPHCLLHAPWTPPSWVLPAGACCAARSRCISSSCLFHISFPLIFAHHNTPECLCDHPSTMLALVTEHLLPSALCQSCPFWLPPSLACLFFLGKDYFLPIAVPHSLGPFCK